MTGREYIEGNLLKELDYREAEKVSIAEFIDRLKYNNNKYSLGWFLDEPMYPCNAELYDEFTDEVNGEPDFDEEGFIAWIIRIINYNSTEYRVDTVWEGKGLDGETYILRGLTEQEKWLME